MDIYCDTCLYSLTQFTEYNFKSSSPPLPLSTTSNPEIMSIQWVCPVLSLCTSRKMSIPIPVHQQPLALSEDSKCYQSLDYLSRDMYVYVSTIYIYSFPSDAVLLLNLYLYLKYTLEITPYWYIKNVLLRANDGRALHCKGSIVRSI